MTRRDFELIARVLDECAADLVSQTPGHVKEYADASARYVAARFATALEVTNDRFDRSRFIEAATRSLT